MKKPQNLEMLVGGSSHPLKSRLLCILITLSKEVCLICIVRALRSPIVCPRKKGGGRGELELLFSKGFLFHSSGRAECGRISAVFCGRTVPFGHCVSCGAALACKESERPG